MRIVILLLMLILIILVALKISTKNIVLCRIEYSIFRLNKNSMTYGESLLMRILLITRFEVNFDELFVDRFGMPTLLKGCLNCVKEGLAPPKISELKLIAQNMNLEVDDVYLGNCIKMTLSILAMRVVSRPTNNRADTYLCYVRQYLESYE